MFEIEKEKPSRFPVRDVPHQNWRGTLSTYEFDQGVSFQGGSQRRSSRIMVSWSLFAAMIDALVAVFLLCFFLLVTFVIQRTNGEVLFDFRSLTSTALWLFILLNVTYLFTARLCLGASLGEWACDLRLGRAQQRFSSRYALLLIKRFVILACTGCLFLPLMSLITGHDWAGKLSGLSLTPADAKN